MRVTLQMSSINSIYNITNNSNSVYNLSEQISSGYAVTKASDNPSAAISAINDYSAITQYESYLSNIKIADSFMGMTDNSLSDVNTILTSVETLAIDMSSGDNTSDMYSGALAEMTELLSSLVSTANSDYSGQYLFAGTDYTKEPFEVVADKYVYFTGNNAEINISTDSSAYTTMNITAEEAFGNLESTITTDSLERVLNLSSSNSTPLTDLNSGAGVASGSITLYYSSAPASLGGLTVDLSASNTLEDVACYIEQASIKQADSYDSTDPEYNYVLEVSLNEDKTGLVITQVDRSTGLVVDLDDTTTYPDASAITLKNTEVARNLGIAGTGSTTGESILAGNDLDPIITNTTLISDISNWDSNSLTIYNGSEDNSTTALSSGDASEYFTTWQLNGLSNGGNITDDDKLYYEMTDLGTGEWEVSIYNSESCTSASLVATGTSDGGLLTFDEVNDSGITGTVNFAPPSSATDPIKGVLTIDYPTSFSSVIAVSDYELSGTEIGTSDISTADLISELSIYGLETGVSTSSSGDFDILIDYTTPSTYNISILNENGDTMLTGQLLGSSSGLIELEAATGYEELSGNITLDCPSSIMTAGSYSIDANATFNTVEDITNAITTSCTYTTAQISEDGTSIEVASQLCGAYLTIADNYIPAVVSGDTNDQLSCLKLNGVVAGVNSDTEGKLYAEVTESFETSTAGTYVVAIYSDAEKTTLVAQAETSNTDGAIQITDVDNSGISGTVYLAYSADDTSIEISNSALISSDDTYSQLSAIDLIGIRPGENSGYSGELYFTVEDVSGTYEVQAYSDSELTDLVASGSTTSDGVVTLSAENSSGISGSLYLTYTADDSDILVTQEAADFSGRECEQNIFSTLTSLIEALSAEDCYAVNDQLDNLDTDLNRILNARALTGAKQENLEMLATRHEQTIDIFTADISSDLKIDLVEASTEYAAQKVAYEAALAATSQLMDVSLLNYI